MQNIGMMVGRFGGIPNLVYKGEGCREIGEGELGG
jgi:hypothetical protein